MMVNALIFPILVFGILTIIKSGFSYFNLFLCIGLFFSIFFSMLFISRRFYIKKLILKDDYLIIEFYSIFRLYEVQLRKDLVQFELSPIKYNLQYLKFVIDKIQLKQFPYYEWNMEKIYQVRKLLKEEGFKEG